MRRKARHILNICAAVITAATLCTSACAADYYADDSMRHISTKKVSPVSGWDFDKSGGEVLYTGNTGVHLSDTSYTDAVTMERTLKLTPSTAFTVEAAFTPDRMVEGIELGLISAGECAVRIATTPKRLVLAVGTAEYDLCDYAANKEIGIKLTINPTSGTVTPMINGKSFPERAMGKQSIDKIRIKTPDSFKANLYVNGVKAYGGYSLNERFLFTGGNIPDNWSTTGDAALVNKANATAPDVYSMSVAESAEVSFPATGAQKSRYEVRFLTENAAQLAFTAEGAAVLTLSAESGALSVDGVSHGNYDKHVWQRIELDVTATGDAVLKRNGKAVANISLSRTGIDGFTVTATDGAVLIDDVLAYGCADEGGVEEVQKTASDKYVGMLRCDIWREGNHLGWDYILPYEDNLPILGTYDDGNVAAADWEIKYMAEHGVDFQMNCWFLPKNYTNETGAIKTPNNAFALEDGYFRSAFSDKLDFAIMWENAEADDISYQTFISNIIPYWSEYYLSDSRYARADGKAIIAIYNADVFLSAVGGGNAETAKAALDALRNECTRLGYDGAYILAASGGLSSLKNEKAMGFDGCFAYTWRDFSGTADAQKSYLARAAANAAEAGIGIVPTASVGIDETPWGRPSGQMLSAEAFKEVVQYADNGVTALGNMLFLDNWNEYGEGHFIMPSAKNGFGYLDAVRSALTQGGDHTDKTPTADDKKKMGTLYDATRKPRPVGEATVPIGNTAAAQWSGENLKDWKKIKEDLTLEYKDQALYGETAKAVAGIYVGGLNIDLDNVNYIELKLSRTCADAQVKVYYVTDNTAAEFAEDYSAYVYAGRAGSTETVYIPVWKCDGFFGTLKQLRIDPINSEGSFKLESVRLLSGSAGDILSLYIENEKQNLSVPLQNIDNRIYISLADAAAHFPIATSYIAAEDGVRITRGGESYLFAADGTLYKENTPVKEYGALKAVCGAYMLPIEAVGDIAGYDLGNAESGAYMTKKPLYPEKTYLAAADTVDGVWLYRNLAQDTECESLNAFWQPTTQNDQGKYAAEISNTVFKSGTGSIKKTLTNWSRLGIEAPLLPNREYHFSAWLKNDDTDTETPFMLAAKYRAYDKNGTQLGEETEAVLTETDEAGLTVNNEWSYVNKSVRITKFYENGDKTTAYNLGVGYTLSDTYLYLTQNEAKTDRTVYMDNLNVRLVPDFRVYVNAVSHFDNALIGNEDIVFTFSADIDPQTVTPECITVNGASAADLVTTRIETDDDTRQTKLYISFNTPLAKDAQARVELAALRDAWGREVLGTNAVTVKGGKPYLTASFEKEEGGTAAHFTPHNADGARLIVVLTKGGALTDVRTYPAEATFDYTIAGDASYDDLRVFVLGDYTRLVPLTEKGVFTKNAIEALIEGSE